MRFESEMQETKLRQAIGFFLSALITVGCARVADSTESIQPRNSVGIINGLKLEKDHPLAKAVVTLEINAGEKFEDWGRCSGLLIDPYVVLTAAHCLEKVAGGALMPPKLENLAFEIYGPTVLVRDFDYNLTYASLVVVHEGFKRSGTAFKADEKGYVNDLALVLLARPLFAYDPEFPKIRLDQEGLARTGERVTVFGTGISDGRINVNGRFEIYGYGRYLKEFGVVAKSLSGVFPDWTFDDVIYLGNTYINDHGTVCNGDSGGPAIIQKDGTPVVVGVVSFGDLHCWSSGGLVSVHAHYDWISKTYQALKDNSPWGWLKRLGLID